MVADCSEQELYLLEYKYFRRKIVLRGRFEGYTLNVSERSYFRMQNALLSKLAAKLLRRGLTEQKFLQDFQSYAPFMRVYRAVRQGREGTVVSRHRTKTLAVRQNSASSCVAEGDLLPRRRKTAIAASAVAATQMSVICRPEIPLCGSSSVPPTSPPDEGRR